MFAWEVAIFRDKYLEIGHSKGEWNLEIDQKRGRVCREFPISAFKRASARVLRGFSGGLECCSGATLGDDAQEPAAHEYSLCLLFVSRALGV